jgi:two-component system OmpR family sensor kinase
LLVASIIALISIFYYESQKKIALSGKRAILSTYAYDQIKKLKTLHHYFDERKEYPRNESFKSAIYDIEFVKIFSILKSPEVDFTRDVYRTKDGYVHYVKMLDEYYLGAKYLFIEVKDDGIWIAEAWRNIIFYSGISFLLLSLSGIFLAKVFVRPMRESIVLLDRFIKDTTHELNTPLSAILANVEMIDQSKIDPEDQKRIKRIVIAARTVSVLYKDLTYITLEADAKSDDKKIALGPIIEDRIEYFDLLAKSKNISFVLDIKNSRITINKNKIIRVLDNLISNAIKYNKRGGKIFITLKKNMLAVEDTGVGMSNEDIPYMFDRYMRFNESEGGFGIGLSIVNKIAQEYNISIDVASTKNQGTRIVLTW